VGDGAGWGCGEAGRCEEVGRRGGGEAEGAEAWRRAYARRRGGEAGMWEGEDAEMWGCEEAGRRRQRGTMVKQ
jgi:hypothetical protein